MGRMVRGRRRWCGLAACVLALCAGASPAAAAVPTSIGALGDSYTAGAFSGTPCALTSALCPENSWSTGTAINSHYLRLRALDTAIDGRNFTFASSGRKMGDLSRQAGLAAAQGVDYVTIMLGLTTRVARARRR